jgi:hypothetical protein
MRSGKAGSKGKLGPLPLHMNRHSERGVYAASTDGGAADFDVEAA